MKKFILFTLLFSICISVKAYENRYFKLDLKDDFKQTVNKTNVYKWEKGNDYIAITISDNTTLQYNVETFTDEDLNNQKVYLEDGINKGLEKYNLKAEVSNLVKVKNDKSTYLEYDVYYPSKKTTGYDTYQKGRMYTTAKYITTVIYNSDKEITEENKNYKSIMDSFIIIDKEINTGVSNSSKIIISIITFGLFIGLIISLIKNKKQ